MRTCAMALMRARRLGPRQRDVVINLAICYGLKHELCRYRACNSVLEGTTAVSFDVSFWHMCVFATTMDGFQEAC